MRTELPCIAARIEALIAHLKVLPTLIALDPRLVLIEVNDAKTKAIQLRLQSLSIVSELGSLKRMRPGSDRVELGAHAKRLGMLFSRLRDTIGQLDAAVAEGLNHPGRWGDAALDGPVQALLGLLNTLLEIWSLEKVRYRLGMGATI